MARLGFSNCLLRGRTPCECHAAHEPGSLAVEYGLIRIVFSRLVNQCVMSQKLMLLSFPLSVESCFVGFQESPDTNLFPSRVRLRTNVVIKRQRPKV